MIGDEKIILSSLTKSCCIVLPESKTFSFGISDSPNIDKVNINISEIFFLKLGAPYALQEKKQNQR